MVAGDGEKETCGEQDMELPEDIAGMVEAAPEDLRDQILAVIQKRRFGKQKWRPGTKVPGGGVLSPRPVQGRSASSVAPAAASPRRR